MHVQPLGESAWIVSELGERAAYEVADAVRAFKGKGIVDVVSSYATVGIYTNDSAISASDIEQIIAEAAHAPVSEAQLHQIPVCYEMGLDLAEVASMLDDDAESVIQDHLSLVYRCYALGFCPGFPYLGYLTERLSSIGRRSSPRTSVEPGSVAIAKGQTSVYPLLRPGGWNLIGHTPLTIVDVEDDYFPIRAGDQVRFVRIDEAEFGRLKGERL